MFVKELPGSGWNKADIFEPGTWPRDGQRIFCCTKEHFMFYGRYERSQAVIYTDLYGHRPIPFAHLIAWQNADFREAAPRPSKPSLKELFHA